MLRVSKRKYRCMEPQRGRLHISSPDGPEQVRLHLRVEEDGRNLKVIVQAFTAENISDDDLALLLFLTPVGWSQCSSGKFVTVQFGPELYEHLPTTLQDVLLNDDDGSFITSKEVDPVRWAAEHQGFDYNLPR